MKIDVILMPQFFSGCRLHSFLHGVDASDARLVYAGKQKRKRVQLIKPKHNVISAHRPTVRLYIEDLNIVTKCKFTFATSFKLSALKLPCRIQTITKSHFTLM